MTEQKMTIIKPGIVISKSGVVQLDYGMLTVNSDNILQECKDAVLAFSPKTDYNGYFAARVTVEIELLGDLEESKEDENNA